MTNALYGFGAAVATAQRAYTPPPAREQFFGATALQWANANLRPLAMAPVGSPQLRAYQEFRATLMRYSNVATPGSATSVRESVDTALAGGARGPLAEPAWNVFIAALAPVQNVMLGSRIGGLPPYILYGVPALLGGMLLFFILRRK